MVINVRTRLKMGSNTCRVLKFVYDFRVGNKHVRYVHKNEKDIKIIILYIFTL